MMRARLGLMTAGELITLACANEEKASERQKRAEDEKPTSLRTA